VSLSALLLLAALASFGSGFDDEDPGDLDRRVGLFAANQMPLRRVERPLSMPKSTYGLRFDLTYTELTRGTPLVRFFGAAGFGLTDDLELGILLLPLSFSPDPATSSSPSARRPTSRPRCLSASTSGAGPSSISRSSPRRSSAPVSSRPCARRSAPASRSSTGSPSSSAASSSSPT